MKNTAMRLTPAALAAAAKGDLHNAMIAATPGGIEAQEKAGQAALVASTNMPLELRPSREAFEKVGFIFGDKIDDVFQSATLPAGWKREATSHDMHSKILDEQGRERVSVFYKAAFYDRRANAGLVCRYRVETQFPDKSNDLPQDEIRYIVTDGGKEIYRTPNVKDRDYPAGDRAEKVARDWLAEAAPDAADPTTYWLKD